MNFSQSAMLYDLSFQFYISRNYTLQNENKNRLNVPILTPQRPSSRCVAAPKTHRTENTRFVFSKHGDTPRAVLSFTFRLFVSSFPFRPVYHSSPYLPHASGSNLG